MRIGQYSHLGFEALIAEALARFLNKPEAELDWEITNVIGQVAEFLGLDQGFLVQWWEDATTPLLTHSWKSRVDLPETVSPAPKIVPWVHQQVALGKTVTYSRVDDLPEEAEKDKECFRASGGKALISLPLKIGGKIVGALVFARLSSEIHWCDEVVSRLQLIADVFVGVLDRQKNKRELKDRLRFEMLLAETSARLINLPAGQLDDEILSTLHLVCERLHMDRSTLWMLSDKDTGTVLLQHFYGRGDRSIPKRLDGRQLFPWTLDKVLAGEVLAISKLSELPSEANRDNETWRSYGTKSALVIPLSTGGSVLGALSFAVLREEREWPEPVINRLKLVAQIFANALARQGAERTLRKSEEQYRGLVETQTEMLCRFLPDSTLLFVNQAYVRYYGKSREDLIGSRLLSFVPPDQHEDVLRHFASFVPGSSIVTSEREVLFPNGERRWQEWTDQAFFDGKGGVCGFQSVGRDITDRKKAEEEIKRAYIEIKRLKEQCEAENIYLREMTNMTGDFKDIIGQSDAMKNVLFKVEQVASTDTTVLITGETGTGKELLALAIHNMSKRKDRTLVTVNCAALPPTLIESELFGREKGAYTGALTKMVGRFEVACGSTIFLDEIGELPVELQGKLLRVIEEGTFERLGSTKAIHVDVRVIAATNRDLAREVREGRFRRDLFYRLNVFPIVIPPLRDRPEDIPLMVWSFVKEFQAKMGKRIDNIQKKTMNSLQSYEWLGNGRELRNVIERAMIVSRGKTLEVLLPETTAVGPSGEEEINLVAVERRHIISVLEKTSWRVTGKGGAAEVLGLKGTTLQSKMKKLGIKRPAFDMKNEERVPAKCR